MFQLREFASVSLAAFFAATVVFVCNALPTHSGTAQPSMVVSTIPVAAEPLTHSHFAVMARMPKLLTTEPGVPADAVAQEQRPPQPLALNASVENEMAKAVAARISQKVPQSLTPYFDLYFYVSKAAAGPWAQRLFIFRKNESGALAFEESFPVSTGREQSEQYFTATPTGFFELDSHRFMPMARSAKWNDAQMPWAMFLNYSYRTQMSGVALHAAIGRHELADLGHRASGGCVRLPLPKANALFHRIQATMAGQVPVFGFDDARGTTNTAGRIVTDSAGKVLVADGYRVLVYIDPYPGPRPEGASS